MKSELTLTAWTLLLISAVNLCAQTPSGKVLWTYTAGYPIVSSPALDRNGAVYVCTSFGLSAVTNAGSAVSNKWTFGASVGASSPSIGADGTIYLASSDGNLYAINPDGSKRWSYSVQCGDGSPAIAVDGTIYIEGYSFLYALTPLGSLKWKSLMGDSGNYSSPAIGPDGSVYIGSRGSTQLYAFAPDGSQKWTYGLSLVDGEAPAIGAGGTIYMSGGSLYAINPDGTTLWTLSGSFGGPPIVGKNGTLYASGSGTHVLSAVTPAGQLAWQALGDPSIFPNTAAAVDGAGTIYYCTSNSIFALSAGGYIQWTIAGPPVPPGIDGAVTSPVVGPDGTLYAALATTLYAVAGTNPPPFTLWPMYQQNAHHAGTVEKPALKQPQKRTDANFEFQLYPQQLGLSYTIEMSTNLNTWTSLTSIVATTLPTDVADLTATNAQFRFYRAVSSQ